jgi:hypothetical protein
MQSFVLPRPIKQHITISRWIIQALDTSNHSLGQASAGMAWTNQAPEGLVLNIFSHRLAGAGNPSFIDCGGALIFSQFLALGYGYAELARPTTRKT